MRNRTGVERVRMPLVRARFYGQKSEAIPMEICDMFATRWCWSKGDSTQYYMRCAILGRSEPMVGWIDGRTSQHNAKSCIRWVVL